MLLSNVWILAALVISIGGLILCRFVRVPLPLKVLLWVVFWLGVLWAGALAWLIFGLNSGMN